MSITLICLVYFIKKGRIKLYVDVNEGNQDATQPLNIAFIAYVEGSYFGDSDIFFQDENKGRDSTSIADTECHLLVLSKKDLISMSEDFEEMSKEMRQIAQERKVNHDQLIREVIEEHQREREKEASLKSARPKINAGNLDDIDNEASRRLYS